MKEHKSVEHSLKVNNMKGSDRDLQSNSRARKRKRCEILKEYGLESDLEECDLEDTIAIETKLRKVAKANSLNDEEMKTLIQKFVKNEHILALVTLKAEDELAREQREAEQHAIIITDTPSVAKLTRAKARELNKTPIISLPSISEPLQPDLASLIKEDLHSDEEDEEYTFKDEDFSDEDINKTVSDFGSIPYQSQAESLNQSEFDNCPIEFTSDDFKIPINNKGCPKIDMRIAMRTRSKLCLQQTTIEDIESEFVPPDVEQFEIQDNDWGPMDEDWMQFLNDISKPINHSYTGDDDDTVNDPEYIAAEKVIIDAEELRDLNISKKELTDLISELFDGLKSESLSLDNLESDTNKLSNAIFSTDNPSLISNTEVKQGKPINFDHTLQPILDKYENICLSESPMNTKLEKPNTNLCNQNTFNNSSHLMSFNIEDKIDETLLSNGNTSINCSQSSTLSKSPYAIPFDNNYTWQYISLNKHIFSEYLMQFEALRTVKPIDNSHLLKNSIGITKLQYDIFQQQMRIHIQILTQTFIQLHCHPDFWKYALSAKQMISEIDQKSYENECFKAWNLKGAVNIIKNWEQECSEDSEANADMMKFIHEEIEQTSRNTRQIPRFPPRIMNLILNSNVFMYPEYLPRVPFLSKVKSFHSFAPSELYLIALGLEKYVNDISETPERISRKSNPILKACGRLCKDFLVGKTKRRLWKFINFLKNVSFYNPIKYYFEHKRAPPTKHKLIVFNNNSASFPKDRIEDLPIIWKDFIKNEYTAPPLKLLKRQHKNEKSKVVLKASDTLLEESINDAQRIKPDVVNINYYCGPIQLLNANANDNFTSCVLNNTILNDPLNSDTDIPNQINKNHLLLELECVKQDFDTWNNSQVTNDVQNLSESSPTKKFGNHEHKNCLSNIKNRDCYKPKTRKRKRVTYLTNTYVTRFKKSTTSLLKKNRKRIYRKRFYELLFNYQQYLKALLSKYITVPLVQYFYVRLKTLELYSNLLFELKMFCNDGNTGSSHFGKRFRSGSLIQSYEDESIGTSRSKRLTRQEENFRHMLLPDSKEDANRKDAIFAFNFYEKVEEIFKSANEQNRMNKFNKILKSFNPRFDKVENLYYNMEKLFLPDHPELAQIFLSFMLPSEAAEIGKFFEHFIIANMTTFINKLNIYFNKQPAQIRKIYNCLNELAEDKEVTLSKIKLKIVPLLKGNRFLIEWFMQQFPKQPLAERFLPLPEYLSLKDAQKNIENATDILDIPGQELYQNDACQLRYINGRIFYGTKMTLPAKLSFMAANYKTRIKNSEGKIEGCSHGIKKHGDQSLFAATTNLLETTCFMETKTKDILFSEDDGSKVLIIDTDDDGDTVETCNDKSLRMHAVRLNPACYDNSYSTFTANTTNSNSKKLNATNTTEEGKTSPRKCNSAAQPNSSVPSLYSAVSLSINHENQSRDKRKSPIKKLKPPINTQTGLTHKVNMQPMVVIHEHNNADTCPTELKSLIEQEEEYHSNTKNPISIVARTKNFTRFANDEYKDEHEESICYSNLVAKFENSHTLFSDKDCDNHNLELVQTQNVLPCINGPHSEDQTWNRDDDKILLTEMKFGSKDVTDLCQRIHDKLPQRTITDIHNRYVFLKDFLSKLYTK